MSEAVRPIPYPADTLARGWRFEMDMEKVKRSDTWLLAKTGEVRGALMLLWGEAWQQTPCGSLPADDQLVALIIDMPRPKFQKHRPVLMRGWWLAADGRLYHDTIVERVLAMLEKRAKDAGRSANRRARQAAASGDPDGVTGSSRVTHEVAPREFDTKHQAPSTSLNTGAPTELVGLPAADQAYRVPNCPHEDIVKAYADLLPMLPQVAVLSDSRKAHVTARWRAVCADQKFTREQGVAWFRDYFGDVARSPFLTGNGKPDRATGRVWAADFDWLMLPTNFVKVVEGRYLERKAA